MKSLLVGWLSGIAALAIVAVLTLATLKREQTAYRAASAAATQTILTGPRDQTLIAPQAPSAQASLAGRIGDNGAAAGVRLTLAPAGAVGAPVVTLRIVAHGDEAHLLRFATVVEQAPPLARFTRWSIQPDGDGMLRLSADVAAPWRLR